MLGPTNAAAIYDYFEDEWREYLEMPTGSNWMSLGCLLQYEDTIWHMSDEIWVLNALTWETRNLGFMPEKHAFPGRCAISEVNGVAGRLLPLQDFKILL